MMRATHQSSDLQPGPIAPRPRYFIAGNPFFTFRPQCALVRTLNLPPLETYLPATFAERGLAVPFISPLLAGVRVRAGSRGGTELILPNPAGGRGVYVASWDSIKEFARPTVHDTMLNRAIGQVIPLTPSGVREACIAVAGTGLAGDAAKEAAARRIVADQDERRMAEFLLTLCLAEQCEPTGLTISAGTERTPLFEERARKTLTQVAQKLGMPRQLITAELEKLAGAFACIGVAADATTARLPNLLTRMGVLRSEILDWSARNEDAHDGTVAKSVAASVGQIVTYASIILQDARDLTGDMFSLLRRWFSRREEIIEQISRIDWLLDGWEAICLLWEMPQPASRRRATILEMALLVPYLPRQTADWVRLDIKLEALEPACRVVPVRDEWRTGSALIGLIARNERLRAMSL